ETTMQREPLRQRRQCIRAQSGTVDAEDRRLFTWPVDDMQRNVRQRDECVVRCDAVDFGVHLVTCSECTGWHGLQLLAQDAPVALIAGRGRVAPAFHRAKTMQDIELMMSLWAEDATLNSQGDPNSPYIGSDSLKTFWLNSGSFTNRRLSLVPSF